MINDALDNELRAMASWLGLDKVIKSRG